MNWALAVLSAVLLVLLFPPYDFSWLAPLALAPLLIACARVKNWKRRFAVSYLCGILYWFGLCNWIQLTLAQYANVNSAAAWGLFCLFCLAKSLHMGMFGALAGILMRSRFAVPLVAALWVAIEWTHGVLGFEWLNLGNAGSEMSLLLRLAPVTGVWGLSFAFALLSTGVACVVLRRPRLELLWLFLLPALWLLPDIPGEQQGKSTAILLQPNQDEGTVWTPELITRSLSTMTMLSLGPTLKHDRTEWIVWPEVPGPYYDYDPQYMGTLQTLAATADASVIAGAVGRSANGAPLNSALAIGANKGLLSRYSKINLVPFGEFVPWPFQEVTKHVSAEAGDFEPGREIVVTASQDQHEGHKEGTFICYEAVFPGFIRQFVNNGAEVLFNISNDGWFGKTAARYQHLRIVRMRAVENKRWILRATNNGVTAAIDPAGRVVQQAPERVATASLMKFRYSSERTVYTRYGDWFVVLCAILSIGALLERNFDLRKKLFHRPLAGSGAAPATPSV